MARDPWDSDVDSLDRSLQEIEGEYRHELDTRLVRRLATVQARHTPLRFVGPAPAPPGARLRFADGTAVIAHSERRGALSRVALALYQRATVLVERVEVTDHGVEVDLHWGRGQEVRAEVLGFDQVD